MERYLQNSRKPKIYIPATKNQKTQNIHLTQGMPIIAHKTNKKLNVLNSQTFIISDVTNEIIRYKDGNARYSIPTSDFHKYFYLGFCMTVYASQGETFHKKYTINDWDIECFCPEPSMSQCQEVQISTTSKSHKKRRNK